MQQSILDQGITLMLVGMGTVFVFLTALVVAMTLLSFVLSRLQKNVRETAVTDEEVAAISAAIIAHRKQ